MALNRHRPYDVPDRYRQTIDPESTGEFASNMARNAWDYWNEQGDFSRPSKWQKQDVQKMEADSTNNAESAPISSDISKSASTNGVGFRGKLTGNTASNFGYEKHYHERAEAHSLRIRSYFYCWPLSKWSKENVNGDKIGQLYGWSKYPGIIYSRYSTMSSSTDLNNLFRPWEQINNDIADNIYAMPINLYVGDFFDNKILQDPSSSNTKKGILNQYRKIRLKSFTVTITPKSFKQNAFEANPQLFTLAENDAVKYEPNQSFNKIKHIVDSDSGDSYRQDYWIYRDIYGYFQDNSGTIPAIPQDAKFTTVVEDTIPRTVHRLRAFDNQVEIMNEGKPFSFTREINPQGAYFMTPFNLWNNKKNSIAALVNELEGQIGSATSSYVNKFPEYFNIVFAPINPAIKTIANLVVTCEASGANPVTGFIPLVQLTTRLHIKFQATWEAFDFNHTAMPITYSNEVIYDPLQMAEDAYLAEMGHRESQIKIGI